MINILAIFTCINYNIIFMCVIKCTDTIKEYKYGAICKINKKTNNFSISNQIKLSFRENETETET